MSLYIDDVLTLIYCTTDNTITDNFLPEFERLDYVQFYWNCNRIGSFRH